MKRLTRASKAPPLAMPSTKGVSMKIDVVIPSRYASARLPHKALKSLEQLRALEQGMPLLSSRLTAVVDPMHRLTWK